MDEVLPARVRFGFPSPLQYIEPCNSLRDRAYEKLNPQDQEKFDRLRNENSTSLMALSMFNYMAMSPVLSTGTLLDVPTDLDESKARCSGDHCNRLSLFSVWNVRPFDRFFCRHASPVAG